MIQTSALFKELDYERAYSSCLARREHEYTEALERAKRELSLVLDQLANVQRALFVSEHTRAAATAALPIADEQIRTHRATIDYWRARTTEVDLLWMELRTHDFARPAALIIGGKIKFYWPA